jgi:hypothetical protein
VPEHYSFLHNGQPVPVRQEAKLRAADFLPAVSLRPLRAAAGGGGAVVVRAREREEPLGEVEFADLAAATLADLRERIAAELDDVPASFVFVVGATPVGQRQEAKKASARRRRRRRPQPPLTGPRADACEHRPRATLYPRAPRRA